MSTKALDTLLLTSECFDWLQQDGINIIWDPSLQHFTFWKEGSDRFTVKADTLHQAIRKARKEQWGTDDEAILSQARHDNSSLIPKSRTLGNRLSLRQLQHLKQDHRILEWFHRHGGQILGKVNANGYTFKTLDGAVISTASGSIKDVIREALGHPLNQNHRN